MVYLNKNNIDKETITDILTLRYAKKLHSPLTKLSWKDFKLDNLEPSVIEIENLIQNNIRESISDPDSKSISVALSGGIDSSLVLALLKKTLPESKIETFSIKFKQQKLLKVLKLNIKLSFLTTIYPNYQKQLVLFSNHFGIFISIM